MMTLRQRRNRASRRGYFRRLAASSQLSLNEAVQSMMSELRQFREEMRDEVKTRRAEIKSLRDGLLQLSERVDSCRTHVVSLDERMKALELKANQGDEANTASVAELERTVAGLRLELNDRERERSVLCSIDVCCMVFNKKWMKDSKKDNPITYREWTDS
ncbi:uncharacterized protein LOC114360774 [Ostrinia furnacalis]|uniref:uncharacterized protein LOC114360774 n=1 Tax=Ostrinia furnacalis TaxID=93504 RepID=UPI00103CF518|nr:uncharacterized protein LOC114360774 [Ostrinia furnacalis]